MFVFVYVSYVSGVFHNVVQYDINIISLKYTKIGKFVNIATSQALFQYSTHDLFALFLGRLQKFGNIA